MVEFSKIVTKDELKDAYLFVKRIFPDLGVSNHYHLEYFTTSLEKECSCSLVIRDCDRIVAVLLGTFNSEAVINVLAVDSDYQRKGLGKKLVLSFEEVMIKKGISKISLGAVHGKEAFYQRLGYKGTVLVQSETMTIEELEQLSFGLSYRSNRYQDQVNQLFIEFEAQYQDIIARYNSPKCHAMVMFTKEIPNL